MGSMVGKKCKYKPFNEWTDGVICADSYSDDGRFMVTDGFAPIAQYDDSLREYTQEDIGKNVILYEEF